MAIDKINLVQSSVKYLESNLSSFTDTDRLSDIIRGSVLTSIMEQDHLDEEDIDYIEDLLIRDDITFIYSNEFFDLMFKMAAETRERSHGAAPLFKAYILPSLYNDIEKHAGAKEISIYKVKLVKWIYDQDEFDILGVCKNKYGSSRWQDLLIAGKLRS